MEKTKINQLAELGQSLWLDYIRRSLIESGELQELVDRGLRGMTSNPKIFDKAISGSDDYDDDLYQLAQQGLSPNEIYESLAVSDIQMAADVLRPVYNRTDSVDGYISLEVSPELAHDTQGTIEEAHRLIKKVDRPNLLIKVPATEEGIPAIETLIGEGHSINVTLMFSLEQYEAVAEAYISGLEKLASNGGDLKKVASVASFFVSRVDVKIDQHLEEIGTAEAISLKGGIGIANAKLAYDRFRKTFQGERWEKLADQGARLQRVLWASTSTKDPAYSDTLYVDNLIGPHTVNTVPPDTLKAFVDHGTVAETVDENLDKARTQLRELDELGIDLDQATDELLVEGVEKFARPFESLMETIALKRVELESGWERMQISLAGYQDRVTQAIDEIEEDHIVSRIWEGDYTIWEEDPQEITNRLGWLNIARSMDESSERLEALVKKVRKNGFNHVLLLGMGGSSLAPELFSHVFNQDNGLPLEVMDSTDPDAVLQYASQFPPDHGLYIVATKSGTTVETRSFFKYFYNLTGRVGKSEAQSPGDHFIAITDPGSPLVDLAEEYEFRTTFLNHPDIGGRYSALSFFGLVPAALVGVDLDRLLHSALSMSSACESCVDTSSNPAVKLGAILGELAKAGRDKLTIITSPEIASFGDWVEQLIAESTGKSGAGILPIVGEPLGPPEVYGDDRLFLSLTLKGQDGATDHGVREKLKALEDAGHPVVRLELRDRYGLGGQFFLWEMATAIAGYRLNIHPFNQPNVESAKKRAREMVEAYKESGELPSEAPAIEERGVTLFGDLKAHSLSEALNEFLGMSSPGDYIALQAFVQPTQKTTQALQALRLKLRDRLKLATTLGYGPRFLHSTGQLHKGDDGSGLFIQFTSDPDQDAAIPNQAGSTQSSISFGVLKMAQARGDRKALQEAGRRIISLHLTTDIPEGINQLASAL